ncbi:DUF6880 family protein [Sphingomonas montana]|uniref:DUF6880 family protein n=1 Tax=Sphingomonas montana TaxID=1843236 RepID=UPI00096C19B2|nr:DUF6880 family protein [Sphingomonas montana]
MATSTLNARNLERLGAPALAELLIEVANGHGAIKRRLRLALADATGPGEIANQVRKRIATIGRARSNLDWRQLRALIADLATQHAAIAGPLATADPVAAHDLLWEFLKLADRLFDRTDDSAGRLLDLFHAAVADLGRLAQAADVPPDKLADRMFDALTGPTRGQYDGLVAALAPRLGADGLIRLNAAIAAWAVATPVADDRDMPPGIGATGIARVATRRAAVARIVGERIADATGNVDAYIAQQPERTRRQPLVATAIARRLLAAGRAEAAMAAIDAADTSRLAYVPPEHDSVRLDILEALGRHAEAQAFRWDRFTAVLHAGHLRDHLRRLPDFDDFEAEQRALALVESYPDAHAALAFLTAWPAYDRAARMVLARPKHFDGDRYEVLADAADLLDGAHPLAATLLRRTMIDFTLRTARAARYAHAGRHLRECAAADTRIADYGALPDHATYAATLHRTHERKTAFWQAAAV